jgi:AraC family transcriptional regulator
MPIDEAAALLTTATLALDTDSDTARTCIQRAAALLGIDLCSRPKGGLAPSQARRVRCYIEDNLCLDINARDLAGIAQLSTSHFFRAFRQSFGEAPRSYLMRRRILRAQELMSTSQLSLQDIARDCGIGDQPHFTRVFRRVTGMNPNAWRRQFCASAPNTRNASCLSK